MWENLGFGWMNDSDFLFGCHFELGVSGSGVGSGVMYGLWRLRGWWWRWWRWYGVWQR